MSLIWKNNALDLLQEILKPQVEVTNKKIKFLKQFNSKKCK